MLPTLLTENLAADPFANGCPADPPERLRLLILWTHESHYLANLINQAASRGHRVTLVSHGVSSTAPFDLEYEHTVSRHVKPSRSALQKLTTRLDPQCILVSGWNQPDYVAIASTRAQQSVRVMAMDNQWRGTIRQRIGRPIFALRYRRSFDYALVPGPRQERLALWLGFNATQILRGGLPCDVSLFQSLAAEPEQYFLTASRIAPEKGLETLLAAYAKYRAGCESPWPLVVCGARDGDLLPQQLGVEYRGFLPPQQLAQAMGRCGAFILSSTFEPWGVVIQEAAAAGRYIICTTECGAADVMLRPQLNGSLVPVGDIEALAQEMLKVAHLPPTTLRAYGALGPILADAATPLSLVQTIERISSFSGG